jgi:hypothetical protein
MGEAAASIGMSRRAFYEHVLPDLRVVRVGRCRLVPVAELRAWCDANATRAAG